MAKHVVPKEVIAERRRNRIKRTRSDEQKRADKKRLVRITTRGQQILPSCIHKYTGSVKQSKGSKKWRSFSVGVNKHIKSKSHKTREKAEYRLIRKNLWKELPIKNMIYLYKNQYYCVLTQGQVMKFSAESMDLVENHTWFSHFNNYTNSYYAETNSVDENGERFTARFNRMIYPDLKKEESADHINRDSLDNNLDNVRRVSMVIQNMNKGLRLDNTSGEPGVTYSKRDNSWIVRWYETIDGERKRPTKRFSVKEYGELAYDKAVAFRREKIASLPDYKLALCIQ